MSRGLGKIERAILAALDREANTLSDEDREVGIERNIPISTTIDLLCQIHGGLDALLQDGKLRAKYNAITRALRSLHRKGLVQSFRFEGQSRWTDAQGAHDFEELDREVKRHGTGWMEKLANRSAGNST